MEILFDIQTFNNFSELSGQLHANIAAILLPNYNYLATFFVNISNLEDSQKWFNEYEEMLKTTIPETKGFQIQGRKVIFRELYHCMHSNKVRQKQGNPILKKPHSLCIRNIECEATIHLRIEHWHLQTSHLLEVNINFVHNHIIHCAKSFSFRRVKEKVRNKYLELFTNGHSLATALYIYEDNLYLSASDDQKLMELLADRAQNPNYHLNKIVDNYNKSEQGCALFQEYNSQLGNAFILCIVTNLINHIYEKINQADELCFMNTSASFELLNILIVLLYMSCIAGALPLGIIVISDKSEATFEKGINLLKVLFSHYAFFSHGPNIGPIVILTNDSQRSFGLLKDIVFARTQAYNSVQVFQFITTSMECFYERRLFGIAHCHPSYIKIAKLNIELSICTCYIGSSGAPCKHQGTVAARYNIGLLNFLHSLTPDDHAHFAYIVHELIANDPLFYASLHTYANNQHKYYKCNNSISPVGNKSHELEEFNVNQTQELKKLNVNQTQESKEFNTVSDGAKIHVQVELVKHQKTNKENVDPQVIPVCKVRKVGKKPHSLSQNIEKN
ncbi:40136_t:CDS:2 [Gigaspora margarita]|uniref:40136_t:CDS:1 n=1 Tax=Gigaspora margarita TaxID=4874 RepID=A0ABN7UYL5_GIGMA|nr:40136_t:CDS:2 [Gigaspora margarita]